MKIDHEKVRKLRQETGRDYGFCQKALIKNRNDYDRALEYIKNYNERPFVRSYRHLVSISLGEKSYRCIIENNSENIIDIPLLIPVVLCILLPVPSMIIGFLLLIIMLTNSSMNFQIGKPVQKAEQTVKKEKKTEKKAAKVPSVSPVSEVLTDEDGFSRVEIL